MQTKVFFLSNISDTSPTHISIASSVLLAGGSFHGAHVQVGEGNHHVKYGKVEAVSFVVVLAHQVQCCGSIE